MTNWNLIKYDSIIFRLRSLLLFFFCIIYTVKDLKKIVFNLYVLVLYLLPILQGQQVVL